MQPFFIFLKIKSLPPYDFHLVFLSVTNNHFFHILQKVIPQFLTICPYILYRPKKAANTLPENHTLFLPVSLSFAQEKKKKKKKKGKNNPTLKNRAASVIYYLWWLSWTAAGACNKDVVIHHKESVDS